MARRIEIPQSPHLQKGEGEAREGRKALRVIVIVMVRVRERVSVRMRVKRREKSEV